MTFVGEVPKDALIGLEKAVLLSAAACPSQSNRYRKRMSVSVAAGPETQVPKRDQDGAAPVFRGAQSAMLGRFPPILLWKQPRRPL